MKPILQALVLAEKVFTTDDGRKIICGTFTAVVFNPQPTVTEAEGGGVIIRGGRAGSPYAYISLTGVVDGTELQLQFVSLKRNHVIFEQEIKVDCHDRLATIELVSALPHLAVPESGTYAFDVVCEGEILGSYRLDITILEPDEGRKSDEAEQ